MITKETARPNESARMKDTARAKPESAICGNVEIGFGLFSPREQEIQMQ